MAFLYLNLNGFVLDETGKRPSIVGLEEEVRDIALKLGMKDEVHFTERKDRLGTWFSFHCSKEIDFNNTQFLNGYIIDREVYDERINCKTCEASVKILCAVCDLCRRCCECVNLEVDGKVAFMGRVLVPWVVESVYSEGGSWYSWSVPKVVRAETHLYARQIISKEMEIDPETVAKSIKRHRTSVRGKTIKWLMKNYPYTRKEAQELVGSVSTDRPIKDRENRW